MFTLYWHRFVVPYWPHIALALGCYMVAAAAGLGTPLIIKYFIDGALTGGDLGYLNAVIMAVIGLYFVRGVFSYVYGYTIARVANQMVTDIRGGSFRRLQDLDYSYFVATPAGEIISLFTNDLALIQQAAVNGIPDIIVESLNLVAIIAIMVYLDWQLAVVTFLTLPFIVLAVNVFNRRIAAFGKLFEASLAKVSAVLQESLQAAAVIRSYVREDYEQARFSCNMRSALGDLIKAQRLNAFLISLVEFLAAIGITTIIWYGGREVIAGRLSVGAMFTFLVYIVNIPVPVKKISIAFTKLKLGAVAWERLAQLNEIPKKIFDGPADMGRAQGIVEFKDVSFEYVPGINALQNINLKASPGETIAIVGPSGAGKSTLANLLLRFYDPTTGAILIDGTDIREYSLRSLRRNIGFIQQDPILFNTTVRENIRYGRPNAGSDEVEQAARLANAHQFISALSQGYDSPVTGLGGSLSGGQRQRLAVARVILLDPPVLLLDEPTAALDTDSEAQVMHALRAIAAGRTMFVITHRLSIIQGTDRIVYLENGRIAEIGTHQELLARGGAYARAVKMGQIGT